MYSQCSTMLLLGVAAVVAVYVLVKWLTGLPRLGHYGDKYVFITGCDTGFGNLLARRLDKMGLHVFAACYTRQGADDLQKASSTKLVTIAPVDISKEESIEKAHRVVLDHLPQNKGLWAIVNNAGVAGSLGPLEWHRRDAFREVLDVNLLGMADVTRIFLPLIRKGQGRIVNMSSIYGRLAEMSNGVYTVSKFAVEGYSDCLRRELYRQGISVHILEPGGFRTAMGNYVTLCESVRSAFSKIPLDVQKFYGKRYIDKLTAIIRRVVEKLSCPDLNLVIDCYEHAITARFPRTRYNPGPWDVSVMLLMCRLPTWLADWLICRSALLPENAIR